MATLVEQVSEKIEERDRLILENKKDQEAIDGPDTVSGSNAYVARLCAPLSSATSAQQVADHGILCATVTQENKAIKDRIIARQPRIIELNSEIKSLEGDPAYAGQLQSDKIKKIILYSLLGVAGLVVLIIVFRKVIQKK